LAVEEQFYLVWPTLLLAFAIVGRRTSRSLLTLQIGLVSLIVLSLAWSIRESATSPTAAYFSPLTRAWELGLGALVAAFALAIPRVPAAVRAGATWVGLALVLFAGFTFTATTMFPGYAALIPVGGTALIIAGGIGGPRGSVAPFLSVKPMRWIG